MKDSYAIFRERKVCILVPTYNNQHALEGVLRDLLTYTDQIIVVNDGSTDSTASILAQFRTVTVLTLPVNRGKGHALQEGFKNAVDREFEYAISIDSDGQHFADDLPVFLNALETNTGALIMGARNMDQENVPGKSNFGRKFSNFWFHFETGQQLQDTQSGYRLYPVQRLKGIRFFTTKFEFEIEVLVRAAWRDISIIEVPVKVFYPEKEKRVSHFRPIRDFTRISVLNTVLVTITLLYIKPRSFFRQLFKGNFRENLLAALTSPPESHAVKAVSVGFGIFIGIFPVWGFQLALAILVAFLLRLNKVLVIVAANISIPPMIPLILFLSHAVGAIWMGDQAVTITWDQTLDLGRLQSSFLQYILGAFTLSIGSGIFFGLMTYGLLKLSARTNSGCL